MNHRPGGTLLEEAVRRASRAFWSQQFFNFLVFGGLAALVNLGAGYMLYSRMLPFHLPYWMAVTLSSMSGLLLNFGLNYAFNFAYRERHMLSQLRTFFTVAVFGVLLTSVISSGTLSLLVRMPELALSEGLKLSKEFAAHVFAVGVVSVYSFAAHKLFSFNVGLRRRLGVLIERRWAS